MPQEGGQREGGWVGGCMVGVGVTGEGTEGHDGAGDEGLCVKAGGVQDRKEEGVRDGEVGEWGMEGRCRVGGHAGSCCACSWHARTPQRRTQQW